MSQARRIIFGPPGTGKTHYLLDLVSQEIANGVAPERIAYVAFTRKAAREGRQRAAAQFNLTDSQLPWFRTLHSMAFAMLGLTKTSMMTRSHYKKVYQELRLGVSDKALGLGHNINEEVESPLVTMGGICDGVYSLSRQTLKPLVETWHSVVETLGGKVTEKQLQAFVAGVKAFKYDNALLDYTDLLEMFIREQCACPVDVAFIDEAQDLTPLQWKMVDVAFGGAKRLYVAGDDDQAIYTWAGASVNKLLTLDGERTVLGKSYRLPRVIHQRACNIADHIRVREPKVWTHNGMEGEIGGFNLRHPEDMSEGSWLLLARDGFSLQKYVELCKERGLIYYKNGKVSVDEIHYEGIVLWEKLRKGQTVKQSDALKVYELMGANIGYRWGAKKFLGVSPDEQVSMADLSEKYGLLTTSPWYDALSSIRKEDLTYYRKVLTRGEKLTAVPRIGISTIHGVKGGEADNVVLMTDVAATSHKQALKRPCEEHRVFYVGVTRARNRLLFIPPSTPSHYRG